MPILIGKQVKIATDNNHHPDFGDKVGTVEDANLTAYIDDGNHDGFLYTVVFDRPVTIDDVVVLKSLFERSELVELSNASLQK